MFSEKSKKNISELYCKLFSIEEIASSIRLQFVFYASWFLCIFDLDKASNQIAGDFNCWSYFQNCIDFLPRNYLSNSYLYTIWTGVVLAWILIAAWSALNKRWALAHFFLALVILWKLVLNFVLINAHKTNFEFFHLIPSLALLFCSNKILVLRYSWALIYLFAARVKFDEGWILGTYFSSLKLGLPLMPDFLISTATNVVIVGEIFLSIGLVSKNKKIQKLSLFSWTAFHLYSVTLVGYYYPVRCLAFLWTIFAIPEKVRNEHVPAKKFIGTRSLSYLFLIAGINFLPTTITENPNITLEGADFGFFMINSNYQCLNEFRIFDKENKEIRSWKKGSTSPMNRCFPQDNFLGIKNICQNFNNSERVSWVFLQSRNGGPFYELINEQNVCLLTYKPFARNEWIKMPEDSLIRGYPFKNSIHEKSQHPKISEVPIIITEDSVFRRHYEFILVFYKLLWVVAFLGLFLKILKTDRSES